MVLERLYSLQWIEKKSRYSFIMGFSYSIIGIFFAMLLFPSMPGIVAIAFTALMLLPSLNNLIQIEAEQAAKEKTFEISDIYKNHRDIFKVYFFMFIGILLAFAFYSIIWPSVATGRVFAEQANILGLAGGAIYGGSIFKSLFLNNLKVLLFCFLTSFVYGCGAVFIITWNASVWGVIFGMIARNSAIVIGKNPFVYFGLTLAAVFPHMILEASGYFLAAISGGIISKAILTEKFFSDRFNKIVEDSLVMLVLALVVLTVAVYVEANLTRYLLGLFGVG